MQQAKLRFIRIQSVCEESFFSVSVRNAVAQFRKISESNTRCGRGLTELENSGQ